jgi:hypothetical protein
VSEASAARNVVERRLQLVAPLATASLGLVVIGGIVIAASFPAPSLATPIALLVVSCVCLLGAAGMLLRQHRFAWPTFVGVGRWALLAYVISAGMIEFAFVHNHMSGAPLVIVSAMLAMFAIDVAFLIAFTAALYHTV